jgi:hypothetical protein
MNVTEMDELKNTNVENMDLNGAGKEGLRPQETRMGECLGKGDNGGGKVWKQYVSLK